MIRKRLWLAWGVWGMLSACGGEPASPVKEDSTATDADAGEDAAEPSEDAEVDVEIDPNAPTTMDRCLRPPCEAAHLPTQPALQLLEDMGDGWKRLMEVDWELAPGTEGYRCMTLTLPEDVYITGFAPQAPIGTHHATYGVNATPMGPDTVASCGVGATGSRRLQGSGAGTAKSHLPPGVAMPLRKGEQVSMNLHLFNLGIATLRGRSGLWVQTAKREDVQAEAEAVLAGPLSLNIPDGRSTQRGSCTIRGDVTLYGVAPHMHQNGVHLRASVQRPGEQVMIYDGNYDFDHQLFHDIPDVALKKGDVVNVECTYQNDTGHIINWGDSSLDEMCFVGLGMYPALGYGGLPCFN